MFQVVPFQGNRYFRYVHGMSHVLCFRLYLFNEIDTLEMFMACPMSYVSGCIFYVNRYPRDVHGMSHELCIRLYLSKEIDTLEIFMACPMSYVLGCIFSRK